MSGSQIRSILNRLERALGRPRTQRLCVVTWPQEPPCENCEYRDRPDIECIVIVQRIIGRDGNPIETIDNAEDTRKQTA
jgi:hypothetical protein